MLFSLLKKKLFNFTEFNHQNCSHKLCEIKIILSFKLYIFTFKLLKNPKFDYYLTLTFLTLTNGNIFLKLIFDRFFSLTAGVELLLE
jgi:hypothetical protein